MATYTEKIIYGMSQIHIAPMQDGGTYGTPVPVLGAKSCECSFEVKFCRLV